MSIHNLESTQGINLTNLNISNKNMDKNKLFGEKKIFKGSGMCAPRKKIGPKMKNFKNFFRFLNRCISDYYHANFRRNRTTFIFRPLNWVFGVKK